MLAPGTYEIRIGGVTAATGEAPPGHMLAIGDAPDMLPGRRTTEPVFGLPAVWVAAGEPVHRRGRRRHARRAGRRRHHPPRRDGPPARAPAALPGRRPRARRRPQGRAARRPSRSSSRACCRSSSVQRVLQGLLDEQVSIRDLGRVLEGVGQRARSTQDPDALLEAARAALGPALTSPYLTEGVLHAVTLDPACRDRGAPRRCGPASRASCWRWTRVSASRIVQDLAALVTQAENSGLHPGPARAGPTSTTASPVTAWQPSPAAGDRLRRDLGGAVDRDHRTGEPWPRICCLRGTTSRRCSCGQRPRAARTRASCAPRRSARAACMGFFAREHFEVAVEIPDAVRGAGPGRRGRRGALRRARGQRVRPRGPARRHGPSSRPGRSAATTRRTTSRSPRSSPRCPRTAPPSPGCSPPRACSASPTG